MSNLLAKCCCGEGVANCCDWWECATTPTTISVHMLYEKVRYYSNGQRLPVESVEWTVTQGSAITQKGTDCTDVLGYDAGCTTANLTWDHSLYNYQWNVNADSTLDGTTGTHPTECSGCTFTGSGNEPACKGKIFACEYRRDVESYTGSLTGSGTGDCIVARADSDILKYGCFDGCGCIRPFIQFRPSSTTLTGEFHYDYGCCTEDTDTEPEPISISFPGFQLVGACGCPGPGSWLDPKNPCDCPRTDLAWDWCTTTCGCSSINQDTLITTGSDTYTWICENYAPDPENPIVTECSATLTYEERCEVTVTVAVA